MKIALAGWGYLIWDRRSLDVAPERMPAQIRTPFQVLVEHELGWRSLAVTDE